MEGESVMSIFSNWTYIGSDTARFGTVCTVCTDRGICTAFTACQYIQSVCMVQYVRYVQYECKVCTDRTFVQYAQTVHTVQSDWHVHTYVCT